MNHIKTSRSFVGMGLVSATAASLCCITPVISLLAGTSSIAANASWIEPVRPFLVGITIGILVLAWYVKLKKDKAATDACGCIDDRKAPFMQSKTFLSLVTVLSVLMLTFPSYANIFYTSPENSNTAVTQTSQLQTSVFTIKGMTCAGCEGIVNSEVAKVKGVVDVKTSYAKRTSTVKYNKSLASLEQLQAAIASTGYKIITIKNQ